MNPKQLGILLAVCVVLGGVGLVITQKDDAAAKARVEKAGEKIFPDLDVNAVSTVVIDNGEATATVRKSDGRWRVAEAADYPANFETVRGLLTKLMDLKSAQVIQVGKADYGRLELAPPGEEDGATRLSLQGEGGNELAALMLGKEHMRKAPANSPFGGGGYPDGRYVTVPDSGTVVLVSETLSEVDTDPNRWIDKTFVKVEKIRSGEARNKDGTVWQVSRSTEGGDLTLAGDVPETHEVDSTKLTGIDSTLRFPNFSKVGGKADSQDWGFAGDDARSFVADTFDGRTWTVKIGKKTADNEYPVQIKVAYEPLPLPAGPKDESDEDKAKRQQAHDDKIAEIRAEVEAAQARYDGWVYLVASYTVDDLLYSRDDLLKEKKAEEEGAPTGGANAQPPVPFLPPGQ